MTARRVGILSETAIGVVAIAWLALVPVPLTGQGPNRRLVDSGLVGLGANQALRVSFANGDTSTTARFQFMDYTDDACLVGTVCSRTVQSQTTSPPQTIEPDGGVTLTFLPTIPQEVVDYARVQVLLRGPDPRGPVSFQIVDAITGAVITQIAGHEMTHG